MPSLTSLDDDDDMFTAARGRAAACALVGTEEFIIPTTRGLEVKPVTILWGNK